MKFYRIKTRNWDILSSLISNSKPTFEVKEKQKEKKSIVDKKAVIDVDAEIAKEAGLNPNGIVIGLVDVGKSCYFIKAIGEKIDRKIEVLIKDSKLESCLLSLMLEFISNKEKIPEIDRCQKIIVTRSQIIVL